MDIYRAIYRAIYIGNYVDIYRAVYRAIYTDNYRAFLVYQCCVLVKL
jgi:hypothetical protein